MSSKEKQAALQIPSKVTVPDAGGVCTGSEGARGLHGSVVPQRAGRVRRCRRRQTIHVPVLPPGDADLR